MYLTAAETDGSAYFTAVESEGDVQRSGSEKPADKSTEKPEEKPAEEPKQASAKVEEKPVEASHHAMSKKFMLTNFFQFLYLAIIFRDLRKKIDGHSCHGLLKQDLAGKISALTKQSVLNSFR